MSDFAQEGGRWYLPNGDPFYTIAGRNGEERPVTLRDARKVNAAPSVTGIIRCAAAPQLEKWKRDQVLLAALTLPQDALETQTEWLKRVEQDWQAQGKTAADRGSMIHGAIEKHYRGQLPDDDLWAHVCIARDKIAENCGQQQWSPERSFTHPSGYGGKTDLHSAQWVLDYKTKDGELPYKLYDEHVMQLAAYRRGLGVTSARCAILFVGRNEPVARFVEAAAADLDRAMAMFDALLIYWQYKNRYFPCLG